MDNLKDMYKVIRCQPEENEWPPNQPKTIVNVALMHHEGEQTQQELIDMSVHRKEGAHAIDKLRVTKSIVDIFATMSKSVLIEGAPGIGKTVLTKEISYYWANNKILVDMILFLLVIRDPQLHTVNNVSKLLHYINNDYLSDGDVECAANELRRSRGTNVVFVLDGYDECPPNSPLKQFIDKLIRGFYLPNCLVVITSRPTASMLLRQIVSRRIEILGFASKEKDEYISGFLNNSSQKIEELEKYLKQHPVINSILYVPLHLAILLYLFKEGNLPETLTEINEFFIVHTIYRHLAKQKQYLFSKFSKLTDLPQSILRFVYQLSALAFKGLQNSQLVFTYSEIEAVCPDVQHMPEVINGFGLLQAVRHYSTVGIGAGSDLSLNFLHFTMQEYLAALYVSILPSDQQSSLIKKTFWDGQYNFMWMMFVGIASIKSKCFDEIFNSIEQIDPACRSKHYLYLFQCCLEEKNSNIIPPAITSIFSDGHINLRGLTLLPHHIVSLTYFMMRSATKWKSLNLDLCNIGCNGMSILFKHSLEIFTAIKSVSLRHNYLTSILGTNIKSNKQSGNHMASDLSSSGLLLVSSLDLSHNQLSDEGLTELMFALRYNSTLIALNVSHNNVSDESSTTICDCLENNKTLQILNISKNWISKRGVMRIVVVCTKNRTLYKLVCTHNNLSKSGLAGINEHIRKENAIEIFEGSWNSISIKNDCLAINTTFLMSGKDGEKVMASDNISKELWLVDEITDIKYRNHFVECCINENEVVLAHIPKECFGVNMFYIMIEKFGIYKTLEKFDVSFVIGETAILTTLNISQTGITDDDTIAISNYLTQNKTLQELNISKNLISKDGVMKIVVACTKHRTLHKLVCTHNNLAKSGLAVINEYIRKENAIKIFEGSWNSISSKDDCLAIKITFHLLDMSSTHSAVGIKSDNIGVELWHLSKITDKKYKEKFIECCIKENESIRFCSSWKYYEIDLLRSVVEVIGKSRLLQKLDISGGDISLDETIIVSSCLKTNTTLIELNISRCGITKQGVTWIAEALQINETLQKLDVSLNQLCNEDTVAISDFLENNKTLQELNISKNWISKEGVMRIVVACTKTRTLHKLVCTHNNLSKSGLAMIIEYIRKENAVEIFEGSWNNISSKNDCLAIKTTFNLLDMFFEYVEELWCLNNINDVKYRTEFVECCIKENDCEQVYIPNHCFGVNLFCMIRQHIGIDRTLRNLNDCIKTTASLVAINISENIICDDDTETISEYLKRNQTLQELNISRNWLSKVGVMRIVVACTKNRTLHKLVCTHNNLSKSGLAVINEYIRKENAVEIFEASWNSISSKNGCLAFKTTLNVSYRDDERIVKLNYISEELWLVDTITDVKYRTEFVECCIKENDSAEIVLFNTTNTVKCHVLSVVNSLGVTDQLQKLDISGYLYDIRTLANGLKTNRTLIELNLSCCELEDKEAKWIADILQTNQTLHKFDISHNNISDDGAVPVSDCLKTNKILQELNISKNWISKEGVMRIVVACATNRTLHKLVCTHNNLSKSGLAMINEYIRKENAVEIFEGSWNSIGSKDDKLAIKTVFHLVVLTSKNDENVIKSDYANEELSCVDEINIRYRTEFVKCCIEDKDFLHTYVPRKCDINIFQMILEVYGIDITLQNISFSKYGINISNSGKTVHLMEINISGNNISDDDTKTISEYLKHNQTLQELNISKNCISKGGVIRIVVACSTNRTLHKLVCTHNNLSKSGLAVINEYIRKKNAVEIFEGSWNSISSKNDCLAIKTTITLLDMSSMDSQVIFKSDDIGEELWYINENNTGYQKEFVNCCISESIAVQIHFPRWYFNVSLSSIVHKTLHMNGLLQKLHISGHVSGNLYFCEGLRSNFTLIELDLSRCGVTDYDVNFIFDVLKTNMSLQKLNISCNVITDDGVAAISDCVKNNNILQELNISKNFFLSKEGVMKIVVACTNNRTLHKLVCTHNNLSKSGLAVINEYIRKENAVEIFEGSWNSISSKNDCLAIKTTIQLLQVISKDDEKVTKVDSISEELWCVNKITDMKYRALFVESCVKDSYSLEAHIPYNCYKVNVFGTIMAVLLMNKTLQSLDISYSKISDGGVLTISNNLKTNTTLIYLNISSNNITNQGTECIAEALSMNIMLQNLDISCNEMSDGGAIAMSNCLKNNKTLKELNISKNWISKEGVMRIVVACKKNRTLHKLVCTHNNLSKSGLAVINEYIRKENALEIFEGSWNSISSKNNCLAIKTKFYWLDVSSRDSIKSDDIREKLWCVDEITDIKYRRKFVECCVMENNSVQVHIQKECHGIDMCGIIVHGLKMNSNLKYIDISSSKMSNKSTNDFAVALQMNATLQKFQTPHCGKDDVTVAISDGIKNNRLLQELNISKHWISNEGLLTIVLACTINRMLYKLVCAHINSSKTGLAVINEYTRNENLWNGNCKNCLAIQTTFCMFDVSSTMGIKSDEISEELWCVDELTNIEFREDFVECCITENENEEIVVHLTCFGVDAFNVIVSSLETNKELNSINMSSCRISDKKTQRIMEVLQKNTALQNLDISQNKISDDGAVAISNYLTQNKSLQELNISKNWISKEGVMTIIVACTKNRTLHKLVCTHNNVSKSGLAVINEYIRKENAVEIFEGSWNSISSKNDCLAINTTFHLLDVSSEDVDNGITSDDITEELWFLCEITDINYRRKCVKCCIEENDFVQLHIPQQCFGVCVLGIVVEVLEKSELLQNLAISGNAFHCNDVAEESDSLEVNVSLFEFDMLNSSITGKRATGIVEALQMNNKLKSFDISHNVISDYESMAISDCLKINTTLTKLNISAVGITSKGAKQIAEALQENTTLQMLDISHNNLSYDGAVVISECLKTNVSLTELKLSGNRFTDVGLNRIAGALEVNDTLIFLDISLNKICNDGALAISKSIKNNKTLQNLNISKNWISKEGVMRIAVACTKNRTLHKLVCTHNNLSKSGLAVINEYIRKENAIEIFEGSWNSISSKSDCLAIKTTFHLLDVSFEDAANGITSDDITEELWFVCEITDINYRRKFVKCCIEENDFVRLHIPLECFGVCVLDIVVEVLEKSELLQNFTISGNDIADSLEAKLDTSPFEYNIITEKAAGIVEALQVNNTLKSLDISHNVISDYESMAIWNSLKTNTTLTNLNISAVSKEAKQIADALQENKTLQILDISHNNLSYDGAVAISECLKTNVSLTELKMSGNNIKDIGVNKIAGALEVNNMLKHLDISFNRLSLYGAVAISRSLKNNKTLHKLNISKNWISKEGIMRIVVACTKNRTLHKLVCTHNNLSKSGLAVINDYIRKENAVEIFEGSWNSISSKNDCLAIITTLHLLDVSSEDGEVTKSDEIQKELWCVDEITDTKYRTEFVGCCIKEDCWIKFHLPQQCYGVDALKIIVDCLGTFQSLGITFRVSNDVVVAISENLKTNTTMIELNMSHNNIEVKKITEALRVNKVLQVLNIAWNELTGYDISKCLKMNKALKKLDISHNRITGEGAIKISDALQVNRILQEFNISWNKLFDGLAVIISESLKTNTTLRELNMSGNDITKEGARKISEILKINRSLQVFNVSYNKLYDDGAVAIIECLKTNATLIELDLSHNYITDQITTKILETLQANKTLQILNVSYNNLSDNGAVALSEGLKTNTTLVELNMSHSYQLEDKSFTSIQYLAFQQ